MMKLPTTITDFTDFSASMSHAMNTGKEVGYTKNDNSLKDNIMYMPVGYHSRASSVVVSGTNIRRPVGQMLDGN